MKLALDPYMLRSVPLLELPGVVADLGYEYIELSPREDFLSVLPASPGGRREESKPFKRALDGAGVRDRLDAAALPVVRPRRGRARGRRPLLETCHPDHRRPGAAPS